MLQYFRRAPDTKASDDFLFVGAYPATGKYDECTSVKDFYPEDPNAAQGPDLRKGRAAAISHVRK